MKYGELRAFSEGLREVSDLRGVKFAIAVVKNAKTVDSEIESLNEAMPEPTEAFEAFQKEASVLKEAYDKADDEEAKVELESKFAELQETHKDAIVERQAQEADFLNTEVEFELIKVDVADIPEGATASMLYKISAMIND
jgi:hypothetical protein